jgi:ribosomal protein L34
MSTREGSQRVREATKAGRLAVASARLSKERA